jgi:hypothetical protein
VLHSCTSMKKAGLLLLFVVASGKEQEMRTARTVRTFQARRAALMPAPLPDNYESAHATVPSLSHARNTSIRSAIASRTCLKTVSRSSSVPMALLGSGKPQCSC